MARADNLFYHNTYGDNTGQAPSETSSAEAADIIDAHPDLKSLGEDDHGQYALADGTRGSFVTIQHDDDATVSRPSTTDVDGVLWVGSVEPDNIETNDLLLNTSSATLSRYDGSSLQEIGGGSGGVEAGSGVSSTGVVIHSNADGNNNDRVVVIGNNSNSGGGSTVAIGDGSNAGNDNDVTIGKSSQAAGGSSTAVGDLAVANGTDSLALGTRSDVDFGADYSVVIGARSSTTSTNRGVLGTSTSETEGTYDWVVPGNLTVNEDFSAPDGVIIQSPDGTNWRVTVDDSGTVSASAV